MENNSRLYALIILNNQNKNALSPSPSPSIITIFSSYLDVRFNKGLIENCDFDIQKHCRNEIVDKDDDESDGDNDHSNGKIFFTCLFLFINLSI